MSSNKTHGGRGGRALFALAMAVAAVTALATPALASSGQGSATIKFAGHAKGRTLSGQGVTVSPEAPATRGDGTVILPISDVDPGAKPAAAVDGSLKFKRGKRSVRLSGLRLDLVEGALTGRLGKAEIPVFMLGATPNVNDETGAIALDAGKLRLTGEAAKALKEKLGLERALVRKGVGGIWVSAKANPTRAASQQVTSGNAAWGVLASWRAYVLGHQGPPPPAPPTNGTIEIGGGATASGPLNSPATTYAFPATGGSFEKGLYGATDRLVLKTQGSVAFKKPMHCINEIKLVDLEVTLDGADSSLVVNQSYDIDKFTGMACEDKPAVVAPGTKIATLDPAGVTPTHSADGKTITWTGIPAKLTAAGAVPFSPTYKEGQVLDPITITVGVG
jgi:Htaa